jgi:hypothetical protein
MHPVGTLRSLVAQLEDVRILLPHPAMGRYRRAVVVVADDQVLRECAVQTPSGLGEGLAYLLWSYVVYPPSSPSLDERKRNSLILAGELPPAPALLKVEILLDVVVSSLLRYVTCGI